MARKKNDLLSCLHNIFWDSLPNVGRSLLLSNKKLIALQTQTTKICREVEAAHKQVEKIRVVATKKGYQDILDIIEEKI